MAAAVVVVEEVAAVEVEVTDELGHPRAPSDSFWFHGTRRMALLLSSPRPDEFVNRKEEKVDS